MAQTSGTTNGSGTTTVAVPAVKRINNWADDVDDDDGMPTQLIQLPTAPRASRVFDDESVPNKPPFIAYLSNLPYDVAQEDVEDFFHGLAIVQIRLPRDDLGSRSRGYGYVEFETRDDLLDAVSMPDPTINNRHIRIDVSNENDQRKQQRDGRGGSRYGDRDRESTSAGDTNWRRGAPLTSNEDRADDRRRGGDRDRDRDYKPRFASSSTASDWRAGERAPVDNDARDGGFRDRYGGRRSNYEERGARPPTTRDPEPARERPKLNLQPRTLPIEPIVVSKAEENANERPASEASESEAAVARPKPVPSAQIFGAAKPVDTAAREREIEERLEREREEARQREQEKRDEERKLKEEAGASTANDSGDGQESVKEVGKRAPEFQSWRRQTDDGDDPPASSFRRHHSPEDSRRGPMRRGVGERDSRDGGEQQRRFDRDRDGGDRRVGDNRRGDNRSFRDDRRDFGPRQNNDRRDRNE